MQIFELLLRGGFIHRILQILFFSLALALSTNKCFIISKFHYFVTVFSTIILIDKWKIFTGRAGRTLSDIISHSMTALSRLVNNLFDSCLSPFVTAIKTWRLSRQKWFLGEHQIIWKSSNTACSWQVPPWERSPLDHWSDCWGDVWARKLQVRER